jgi:methyl-accepting chemotaxis protein
MDQVTQQNAALVEEAAAAAGSMQDQAAQLAQVVRMFKLNAPARATRAASATPSRGLPRPAPAPRATRAALGNATARVNAAEWEDL